MPKSKRFWILLAIFQIIFGFVVFVATRSVYLNDLQGPGDRLSNLTPLPSAQSRQTLELNPVMLRSLMDLGPDTKDPIAISLLANEYFNAKQYAEAADLYEQLLTFGSSNADVHNNLGLTLHYLGRSDEALARLEEGVALDSTNQRIWLTLGFVNSVTGNVDEARTALTSAIHINAGNEIGQSAAEMLDNLEQ